METPDLARHHATAAEQGETAERRRQFPIVDISPDDAPSTETTATTLAAVKATIAEREQLKDARRSLGLETHQEALSDISRENCTRLRQAFVDAALAKGMFATAEEAQKAIEEEKKRVEENLTLTVNLSPASIGRFFSTGKQETFWDHLAESNSLDTMKHAGTTQGKNLHEEYIAYRKTAEEALRQFVPEGHRGHHPVYAALAGGANDNLQRGACPEYGTMFIELDVGELTHSALNFCDSFANVARHDDGTYTFDTSSLLSIDDAEEMKAIVNLAQRQNRRFATVSGMVDSKDADKIVRVGDKSSSYVEVAVFDTITPEKVKRVGIAFTEKRDAEGVGPLLATYPQLREIATVHIANDKAIDAVSGSWLKEQFKERFTANDELPNTDDVWQELGISPGASYDEVKGAIDGARERLWKDIRRHVGVDVRTTPVSYSNIARVRSAAWRLEGRPDLQQKAALYCKLEEAKVFFA